MRKCAWIALTVLGLSSCSGGGPHRLLVADADGADPDADLPGGTGAVGGAAGADSGRSHSGGGATGGTAGTDTTADASSGAAEDAQGISAPDGAIAGDDAPPSDHGDAALPPPGASSIFDGTTLAGWDGSPDNWSVKDGAITGMSNSAGKFPGTFIASKGDYGDFRVRLTARLAQSNNHLGVCVWGSHLPIGNYGAGKCLVAIPPDGSMWDYGKGAIHGAKVGNAGVDQHTWHQIELVTHLATGEIVMAVNGVQVTKYQDPNPGRFKAGPIRLQLHAWTGPQEAQYKDISVEPNITDYRLLTVK
jgi:hypothetical protein